MVQTFVSHKSVEGEFQIEWFCYSNRTLYPEIYCSKSNIVVKILVERVICISLIWNPNSRTSRSQMLFKIGVLKNYANFPGKHLCRSLFLIKACSLIKMSLQHVFSCEICEILKTPIYIEHLWWLLPRWTFRRLVMFPWPYS